MTEQVAVRGVPDRHPISSLNLDPLNPRLPPSESPRSQDQLVSLLARDYSLLDIGRSIADNGFFEEEPLAAVREGRADPPWTVIEGNRRLASLKLLADDSLRARLAGELGREMSQWRQLASSQKSAVAGVPVIMYEARKELLTFMGFRHITGVQPWDPLAKARFVSSLIEDHHMDFRQAALRIGSRQAHVRQVYLAYRVYGQAASAGVDTSSLEKSYGVFTRAMSSADLKEHMGISLSAESVDDPAAMVNPVPEASLPMLGETVSWIAGTADVPAVITDSRQITDLGHVVKSKDALAVLRTTRDLQRAVELTPAPQRRIVANLERVLALIESARLDISPTVVGDEVRTLAGRVALAASELKRAVDDAPRSC